MAATPDPKSKPYTKRASSLVVFGMMLFAIERFGLSRYEGQNGSAHIDSNLLSVLVLAPLILIGAGIVVFVVGRMRRR